MEALSLQGAIVRMAAEVTIASIVNQRDERHDKSPTSRHGSAWQAAIDYGIDVSQTEYLLTLTPHERLIRHEQALKLVRALREAGIRYYGFDPRHPEPAGGE